MFRIAQCIGVLFLSLAATSLAAQVAQETNGGDTFISGSSVSQSLSAQNDVFVSGATLTLSGEAGGDVHAAGFDVVVGTQTRGNLYAAGASVTVSSSVGEDLSAAGFSVRTAQSSRTDGNVRLMGQTLTIDGPVGGALTATGYEVILNTQVAGDAWIVAEKITYGPNAMIGGRLKYQSTSEITPPERVIAPERVSFEKMTPSAAMTAARESWENHEFRVFPAFATLLGAFLVLLAFILVVGAIFLTFLPKRVERLRASIWERPGATFLIGVIGLSVLFGMVPITGMTIIGLPFVPVVMLTIFVTWTLGYILAAYAVGLRVVQAFGKSEEPSMFVRIASLALAVVLIAILNFIPFVGWVANFTLVLLGIGAMTNMLFERIVGTGKMLDVDMNPTSE